MLKLLKKLFKDKKQLRLLALVIVLVFSLIWRFYNYPERWVLNQDDARDVVIANYIVDNKIIPLVGPTSSAGPFSFGPIYYWIVAGFVILTNGIINGPWICITFLSVISAVLMFLAVQKKGKILHGFILGILTAFSTLEITNSFSVTNPFLSGFFSFVALYFVLRILNEDKIFDWFGIGVAIGVSINSHFQSAGLAILPILLFCTSQLSLNKRIKSLAFAFFGLFLSFIPLLIFDFKNNFIWVKSILSYLLQGQNKFYLPVRWLTDLSIFWPEKFGTVIAGFPLLGYIIIVLAGLMLLARFYKKRPLSKEIIVILVAFFIQMILIRYYKGSRDSIYLIFINPFIIYITGWVVSELIAVNKLLGSVFFMSLVVIAVIFNIKILSSKTQTAKIITIRDEILNRGYNSVRLYAFGSSRMLSLPLYYLLDYKDILSDESNDILIACDNFYQPVDKCKMFGDEYKEYVSEITQFEGYRVYKVASSLPRILESTDLRLMNGKNIYNELYINYPQLIK